MSNAAVMYVADLERMTRFYSELGPILEATKRGEYAVLTGPQFELSIIQSRQASRATASKPAEMREHTSIKLVFLVPSIDATLQTTSALGGRLIPGSRKWEFRGHAIQDAIDPEGNVYQLREKL